MNIFLGTFSPKVLAFFIIPLILLIMAPFLGLGSYLIKILILSNIFGIYAASWDILHTTGQVSLGHALFFGVAGYTAGLLSIHVGLPPWVTIPLAAIATIPLALLVGIPCLRLKGPYIVMATMAFPLILSSLLYLFPITGGEMGIYGIQRLFPVSDPPMVGEYYSSLILMLGSLFLLLMIANSRFGLIFKAIKENELGTEASGINTTKYKILSFIVSAFFAGLAGGFYAHFFGTIGPSSLGIITSVTAIMMTVIGGPGTIIGAVGGAYILTFLSEFLRVIDVLRLIIYTLTLVVVVVLFPQGLIKSAVMYIRALYHRVRD